jgi:hypothetical protein
MEKAEPSQSEPIAISRHGLDAFLMGTLLLCCVAVSTVVIVIFTKDLLAARSFVSLMFLGLGAPLLIAADLYVAVFWLRIASRAEFGGDIELRTLLGRRRYTWRKLGRLVMVEQNWPIPSRFIIRMVFTDGRRYTTFADRNQGEALFALAERQPWAKGWCGAPLSSGMALSFIGLGVMAVFLGLLIICDPLAEAVRNGPGGNEVEDFVGLLLAAAIVPLAGLAGIAAGAHHLIRQPIVIRPGIVRLREGDPATSSEAL